MNKHKRLILILGLLVLLVGVTPTWAAEEAHESAAAVKAERHHWATAFIALAAALSVGLCAIATGLAQSRIGAAGCGAIAEKPETAGTIKSVLSRTPWINANVKIYSDSKNSNERKN
ncbi:hypothetical protein ACFL6U_18235 [Planctomycetota bacterium]